MKKQLLTIIYQKLEEALAKYNISDIGHLDLQTPPDKNNGDFSINIAMRLAKQAKCAPKALAEDIKAALDIETQWFEKIEIAGPGFINLFLKNQGIESCFNELSKQKNLISDENKIKETTVIDYSSVNIAKEMHVGHLRSTIIGDVLSRVLEALGNKVIRQNHLGDWGLPMGMVVSKAKPIIEQAQKDGVDLETVLPLSKLEELYKEASAESKADPEKAQAYQHCVVQLQQGDEELLDIWQKVVRVSMAEVYRIYGQLNVKLTPADECGESFYRDMLAETVQILEQTGLTEESDGAKCIFLDEFKAKDGTPLPIIVQKSDGGYNYSTFDFAAMRHRTHTLKGDRLIYVTDARQALHFKQIFAASRAAKLMPNPDVKLEHVTFGSILGEDNKPLKTRSGENVKLAELLNEAIDGAYKVVNEKNPNLTEAQKQNIASMVGIGAIKYADLAQNRNNDYVFSFDRMLALNGNTAPYLQYAHARICSIFRRMEKALESFSANAQITAPEERDLMLKILDFSSALKAVAQDLRPHVLCNYLYELATCFSAFYDKCPIARCEDQNIQLSRLAICKLTQRTLQTGLDLLGIIAPMEM